MCFSEGAGADEWDEKATNNKSTSKNIRSNIYERRYKMMRSLKNVYTVNIDDNFTSSI